MPICSERTRGSWGARPGLRQRAGLVLACLIGGLSVLAQPAAAQHVNYFWSVVEGSTTLQPGESVTLQLNALRTPGFPKTTNYGGGRFTVLINGWGESDALITNTDGTFSPENLDDTPSNYLGRKPSGFFNGGFFTPGYRASPFQLGYELQLISPNVQELISNLSDPGINHSQAVLLNPGDPANPDHFFRIKYVAGNSLGVRNFQSAFTFSFVNRGGIPTPATFTDGSIEITVVPSSSAVSLLAFSAGALWRRRR